MLRKLNNAPRLMTLTFPRKNGPQATLLINELIAEEHLSSDFTFTLQVLSDDAEIALKDVQGKMVCVELLRDDHSKRYFNGYCFEFSLQKIDNGTAVYQMILKPWLALLGLRTDFYIFHNLTLQEQTKEIFLDYGTASFDMKLREGDYKRTFTVQYDETDANFLHRHWEEHGLHYWYEHTAEGHSLMLADYSMAAMPIDGKPTIPLHHDGGTNKFDKISNWQPQRALVSGKVSYSSYDFKSPTPVMVAETSLHKQGDIHKVEQYRYRGLYGYKDSAMGKLMAQRKMEQIDASGKTFTAVSDSRYIKPGRWFRLTKDHFGQAMQGSNPKNEFLVLSCTHIARNNLLNSEGGEAFYSNSFTCIRRNVRWRPPVGFNSTPTKVQGVDTATVVGPAGEEIYTDKYGNIKVQFHWDRQGKLDEKSSCWVRVATPWANKNFGMIAIPRIGTEVIIQYLQGNPDRPIATGQVYNQRNMPPWDLPANKTQSGVLTRSSKGGTPANANALRFEDKKGAEQVYIQAERNMDVHVKSDDSQTIGNDRLINVHGKHTEKIDKDMSVTVDGSLTEIIKKNMSLDVLDGEQKTTVKGDISVQSTHEGIIVTAKKHIVFVVGSSSITMLPDQIIVKPRFLSWTGPSRQFTGFPARRNDDAASMLLGGATTLGSRETSNRACSALTQRLNLKRA